MSWNPHLTCHPTSPSPSLIFGYGYALNPTCLGVSPRLVSPLPSSLFPLPPHLSRLSSLVPRFSSLISHLSSLVSSLVSSLSSLVFHPLSPLGPSVSPFTMQTCTGSSKDSDSGAACTCQRFIPKRSPKEHKCLTCGHRKVAHADVDTIADTTATSHKNKKYIERLFSSLATSTKAAAHETARQETVKGYRPSPPMGFVRIPTASMHNPTLTPSHFVCWPLQSAPSKAKGKSVRRTSTRISSGQSGSGSVKIGRIVFFPCGVDVIMNFSVSLTFCTL